MNRRETEPPVKCGQIDRLEQLQDQLQNRTRAIGLREILGLVIAEFRLWHQDHGRLRRRMDDMETWRQYDSEGRQEIAGRVEALERRVDVDAGDYRDADARIDSLSQRCDELEREYEEIGERLPYVKFRPEIVDTIAKLGTDTGPLPAITDPEVFVRELYDRVVLLPPGPGVGPDVVRREHVLGLIRDLLENRGINPRQILNPNVLERCRGQIESVFDRPRCELLAGHPGPHGFAT